MDSSGIGYKLLRAVSFNRSFMYGLDSSIDEIMPSLFAFSPIQHTVWSSALKISKEKLELKMK